MDGNPYNENQDLVKTSSSLAGNEGATTTAFIITMTVLVLFVVTVVICFCRGGRSSDGGTLVAPMPRGFTRIG